MFENQYVNSTTFRAFQWKQELKVLTINQSGFKGFKQRNQKWLFTQYNITPHCSGPFRLQRTQYYPSSAVVGLTCKAANNEESMFLGKFVVTWNVDFLNGPFRRNISINSVGLLRQQHRLLVCFNLYKYQEIKSAKLMSLNCIFKSIKSEIYRNSPATLPNWRGGVYPDGGV